MFTCAVCGSVAAFACAWGGRVAGFANPLQLPCFLAFAHAILQVSKLTLREMFKTHKPAKPRL